MSLVDVARRVVIGTNRWPGLETLYSQAYDLGLAFTANRLSSVPGVVAVMLRTNDDGPAWVPGLSDYDLTVVTEHYEGAHELRFLDYLWQRYRSVKRCVPQLGEMEVLNVEDYGDLLDFGPTPTASLKGAHPLFVRAGHGQVERVLQRVPRRPRQREFLLDALSRYSRFAFPAWLEDASRENGMTRRRAEHLLGNVSKRLARLSGVTETAATGTVADQMVRVFQALSQACSLMEPNDTEPATVVDHDPSLIANDAVVPIQAFCETTIRQAGVESCSPVIWISYMSVDRLNLVFVVPDAVPEEELRRLLLTLKAFDHTLEGLLARISTDSGAPRYFRSSFPTVASDSMWRCWRDLSAFDGVAIAATRRTLIGATHHCEAAPSLSALRRAAEVQYASLLPLKNNWRPSRGRPPGGSYAPLVNHAQGYASAFTERVLTMPAALEFTSTEDGYLAAVDALKELRASIAKAKTMSRPS